MHGIGSWARNEGTWAAASLRFRFCGHPYDLLLIQSI
jgi:hypothetical protein